MAVVLPQPRCSSPCAHRAPARTSLQCLAGAPPLFPACSRVFKLGRPSPWRAPLAPTRRLPTPGLQLAQGGFLCRPCARPDPRRPCSSPLHPAAPYSLLCLAMALLPACALKSQCAQLAPARRSSFPSRLVPRARIWLLTPSRALIPMAEHIPWLVAAAKPR
jgi:hypothetical protein